MGLALVGGCSLDSVGARGPEPGPSSTGRLVETGPQLRAVNFGFEDVTDPEQDWAAIDERLAAADVNAISLAVGRPDWTAFRWPDHLGATSSPARDSLQDPLAVALRELRTDPDGTERSITLTVDVFAPRMLAEDPGLAGRTADGSSSELYASASALHDGDVGERLGELVEYIATTYAPDRVAVTELMFDSHTFGPDDLVLFQDMTGAPDWPRTIDGDIDTDSEQVAEWRARAMGGIVSSLRDRAHAGGAELAMDVRVDWDEPAAGRPMSGHDYGVLADSADHLVLWAYPALDERDPVETGTLVSDLVEAGWDPHDFTVSVGLWADDAYDRTGDAAADGGDTTQVMTPHDMARALGAAAGAGAESMSVTPASMMGPGHWKVLPTSWTP